MMQNSTIVMNRNSQTYILELPRTTEKSPVSDMAFFLDLNLIKTYSNSV